MDSHMKAGYTINLGTPNVDNAPLLASVAASANALGNTEAVLRENDSGKTAVMTVQALEAMDLCREFKSLDQHVQTVCRSLKGLQGQEAAVRNVLNNLRERGLLIEAQAWLATLSVQPQTTVSRFRTIIIRTADRSACVQRLLHGLRAHEQRWRSNHRYVLVDISRDPTEHASNAGALSEFTAATGCRALHFDRAQIARRLRELQAELPEHSESLAYLLDAERYPIGYHGAYGVSLNWANLLASGERFVLLDDDYLLPIRLHPNWQRGLRFTRQPAIDGLFASLEDALGQGVELDQDPLVMHAEICGHGLGHLLSQQEALRLRPADLRGLAPSHLPALRGDSRVIASCQGHRGDTGGMGLNWLLLQPPEVLKAQLADPQFYRGQVQRPTLWSGSAHFQLVDRRDLPPFMIDASRRLPPVPPVGRGEDAFFATCLEAVNPDALTVELPLAIGHQRPSVPDRSGAFDRPSTPVAAQLLASQLRSWANDLRGHDSDRRLAVLGAQLADLASMSTHEASAYLEGYLIEHRANLVAAMQACHQAAENPPAHWVADLTAQIEANGRALTAGGAARLSEWPEDLDREQAAERFRGYVLPMARSMQSWAAICEVAGARAPTWLDAD